MHAFDYKSPEVLAEALQQLADSDGSAKPLAGGTDLIDQMRTGRHQPTLVIDIKKLAELNVLECSGDGLHVGAATPCYRICGDDNVQQDYTALADACNIIGGVQIQSRASVGGNLCNSGPAGDSIPAMIALGGICVIAGSAGTREVPVAEFCTGPGQNVLAENELLVEIRFPPRPTASGSHYRRMIPRNEMDIAVVGVGASVTLNEAGTTITDACIGLGAVGPTPLLAARAGECLVGQTVSDATLANAVEAAKEIISPITDMRGTQEYRVHVTGVLVRRVLETAISRATGDPCVVRPGH
ncbi:MAG: xanthine dehydrogenase family protein subunit M [Pirellulaceae bacterium]